MSSSGVKTADASSMISEETSPWGMRVTASVSARAARSRSAKNGVSPGAQCVQTVL